MARVSLVNFAAAAKEAASRAPASARFGRYKVFISALGATATTKRLLVEAHRAGLLRLARADLTPAMDRAMVEASRTTYMHAEWHLLDLE